jgi:radical SAM-linked protein
VKGGAFFPVRLRYTKRGKVRWVGHRDVARALERAFRITQLPLAFTEGFSPRPKVSFGLALPTGCESDAEYLDIVLAEVIDLDGLPAVLTEAMPAGMTISGAALLDERAPALQEIVTAVVWHVDVTRGDGNPVDEGALRQIVAAGLAAPTLPAMRRRKGREAIEDIRPVIRRVDVLTGEAVEMELNTQPRSAKPSEVLAAFGDLGEARALRTHQWIERDGTRVEPLATDTRPRVAEARAS